MSKFSHFPCGFFHVLCFSSVFEVKFSMFYILPFSEWIFPCSTVFRFWSGYFHVLQIFFTETKEKRNVPQQLYEGVLPEDKGVCQQGSNSFNSWQKLHLVIQTGNNMQGKPPPRWGSGGEGRGGGGVHSQNRRPRTRQSLGLSPHILRMSPTYYGHQANCILNLNIDRSRGVGRGGFLCYRSCVIIWIVKE